MWSPVARANNAQRGDDGLAGVCAVSVVGKGVERRGGLTSRRASLTAALRMSSPYPTRGPRAEEREERFPGNRIVAGGGGGGATQV